MVSNNKSVKEFFLIYISKIALNLRQYIFLLFFIEKLNGIEDRSRHYTSNLVKLGLADEQRNISSVGRLLHSPNFLSRDKLEKLIPIDNVNIIYLRQLLKLRIFDKSQTKYYAPFYFAVYILLKKQRVTEASFLEMVQGNTPYKPIDNIDNYIDNYKETNIVNDYKIDIPPEIKNSKLLEEIKFKSHFRNKKSTTAVSIYYQYYIKLYEFIENKTTANLDALLDYYEQNKAMLKKAFGCGKNIFKTKTGERPNPSDFIIEHDDIFNNPNINEYLYMQYSKSKRLDSINEYSDTMKRIFKATGIISFDNGFVELANRELCECLFNREYLKQNIFRQNGSYNNYETGIDSYYCSDKTFAEIFEYNDDNISEVMLKVQQTFPDNKITDIPFILAKKRSDEFKQYIVNKYPKPKVKEILALFNDRSNDKQIKDMISTIATVPTIYEYMVGIAWFYFSDMKIDLLNSFNLTLSANFEPLMHAGGGQGDIVIKEKNKVIMLEVTMMNTNSQKRGEWEPVLRHAVNLKIEEETNQTGREVTTFFIADEFDANTINIWKVIASVPLQSSFDKEKFTDNVIIMPINTNELSELMDKSDQYDEIIKNVRQLFQNDIMEFDMNWRNKFVSKMI